MKWRDVQNWTMALMMRAFTLDLPERVEAWVKKNVKLTKEESKQFPGYYDPDRSPTVSILFDFIESDDYDEFINPKSSQQGMTLGVLAALMHKMKFNPQDVIYAINNREEIKRIGETRLKPMIRNCEAIASRLPQSKGQIDEDKLQNMTLYLNGMTVYLIGSQSPGAAANKSAAWAIVDETDETPEEMKGGESTIVDLLRDRLKRQEGSKLIVFSKPRNEEDVIWPEFLSGSRHRCFVPCPHCSGELPPDAIHGPRLRAQLQMPLPRGYQTLVRAGLRYEHCKTAEGRWDYDLILRDTWYECNQCGGRIEEHHKEWMLQHRLYIPTNTPDGALQDDGKTIKADISEDGHVQPIPRKLSYQAGDFYALHYMPRSTLGHLALEIVSANNSSKRKKFRRSREGLPVGPENRDNARTIADIRALQGQFARGHCSRVPLAIIMGVDVQHYGRKWVKCAFFEDDSMELLDYGIVFKGYTGLLDEARKPVIVDDWGDTPEDERINPVVDFALIDEGDGQRTKSVLEFCTTKGAYRLFYPAKGRGGSQTASMKDLVQKQAQNRYNRMALPRYIFNADAFAEELYDERIGQAAEIAAALRKGLTPPAGQFRIYRNPDNDLCAELTTHRRWTEDDEKERQRNKKKLTRRGRVLKIGDWFRDGGPDDWGDAVTECLAGWYKIRARFGIGLEALHADDDDDENDTDIDTPDDSDA
jgi:hypothetical protein